MLPISMNLGRKAGPNKGQNPLCPPAILGMLWQTEMEAKRGLECGYLMSHLG